MVGSDGATKERCHPEAAQRPSSPSSLLCYKLPVERRESEAWEITGADGHPIFGDGHRPAGTPRGVVLIAHGFKGYKDYGMFPRLAAAIADAGFIAHRFNFSHSGMTTDTATFARPELFERDTWNKQVADLWTVVQAAHQGEIAGQGLPQVLLGHSRGGVTVLLTAGRFADDPAFPQPVGLITAAAPSTCNSLTEDQLHQLIDAGFLPSPSSRTGEELRVGRAFVQEQLDDPPAHDLLALCSRIRCPVLVIHGADDPTVPVGCARELTSGIVDSSSCVIEGGDHVFNTPNPMADASSPSPQLQALLDAATGFVARCVG